MKKFLALSLALLCCFSAFSFSACNNTSKGKVGIKYYAEGSQIVSAMLSGEETIGLVPEPAASTLIKKAKNEQNKTIYKLDLQELYDGAAKAYPQAVMMVKSSVIKTYPQKVDVLDDIDQNVAWLKQ